MRLVRIGVELAKIGVRLAKKAEKGIKVLTFSLMYDIMRA